MKNLHKVLHKQLSCHVSKDIPCLHFGVDQVLSISGYDLENGRMPCKHKYWIKNMAVKIRILMVLFWFCSDFVYFADFLLSLLLLLTLNLKSIDRISIYFTEIELKKSFLKVSPYLYMSPSECYGVINFRNSSYLCWRLL